MFEGLAVKKKKIHPIQLRSLIEKNLIYELHQMGTSPHKRMGISGLKYNPGDNNGALFNFFKYLFIHLFIVGCTGSLLRHAGSL